MRRVQVVVGAVEVERVVLGPEPVMIVHASSRLSTASRGEMNGMPQASYSRRASGWPGADPTPIPTVSVPPETMSTVAAILARTAGGRNRLLVTIRPRPKRSVCAARAVSSDQPSSTGPDRSP